MEYIYALTSEGFKNKQDYLDGSPRTEYFYVGRTKNIEQRKNSHASSARTGSTYPYHEKIRELGENWDIEQIESVPENEVSDREEFHIIRLTLEGHSLLNIKRGDLIRAELNEKFNKLKEIGVKSSKDYAKIKMDYRESKIVERERRQINKSLVHIGLDESRKYRRWRLGNREITCDRYLSRKEIVDLQLPSTSKPLNELFSTIEHLLYKS